MPRIGLARMILTISVAIMLPIIAYILHPSWFSNASTYHMPGPDLTATANILPTVQRRATATPATPRIGMVQHLDDIWVRPYRVEHTMGARGISPNLGDEFLEVYLRISNRSQIDFPVRQSYFQVLDGHGQLDPPFTQDFTRRKLREVQLIPGGHTEGTLLFEVPANDLFTQLIYQPDTLDPSKRKIWDFR